ncbi:MAG: tetratricopeptide repeat protein [Alphaproteobacteria bacterium]|nr:tetratricopeptide repeat protein [Alphaproteobacteria bacterium]
MTSSLIDSVSRALREDRAIEAEDLCRQAIDKASGDDRAWYLLGVALAKQGRHADALPAFERAVECDAADVHSLGALARTLNLLGRSKDAEEVYEKVLGVDPDEPSALVALGKAAEEAGTFARAYDFFDRATRADPKNVAAWFHRADASRRNGDGEGTIEAYRRAAELEPGNAILRMALGEALAQNERWAEASEILATAVGDEPSDAEAWRILGLCREKLGDRTGAIDALEQIVRIAPDLSDGHFRLGLARDRAGDGDAALASYDRVLELDPRHADTLFNSGLIHEARHDYQRALSCYQRALDADQNHVDAALGRLQLLRLTGAIAESIAESDRLLARHPDNAKAHFNKGLALLQQGRWAEAWPEYEWRCEEPGLMARSGFHAFRRPKWQGERLTGERVLVLCEQGFGDALQFARYLPRIGRRGGRIIVECGKELVELFRASFPDAEIVRSTKGTDPAIDYDLHVPLMSLPGIFGTTVDTVPADVPYLTADPQRRDIPAETVRDRRLKVGLVWAGNPKNAVDRFRSIAIEQLAPLGEIDGVALFSLQVGAPRRQVASAAFDLIDLGGRLGDFADTAAVMANLDLVITVETAAAHLAGALARPAWTLLPHAADWRWGSDDSRISWYPTMRLFRQPRPGAWGPVVDAVASALGDRVATKAQAQ